MIITIPEFSTMKRILTLSALAVSALSLANCASEPAPVVHHHYYRTTRYVSTPSTSVSYPKSAGVSGGYSSPEAFQAVTPPSSYSQ